MTVSSLIACPSPRDVLAVKESHKGIKNIAKLYVKYWPEELAYSIIKDYFLNYTNADYLIIAPDDLMVGDYHHQQLVETIEKYGKENMPVLSGVCNVHNIPGYITQLAICIDRPISPQRRHRNYKWADLRHQDFRKRYLNMDRVEVKFAGFPFMFIRRDIVERVGLDADLSYNPNHRVREGYSIDVVFCHHCLEQNIPIYVNPKVQMLHLRGSNNADYPGIEPIKVYKEKPKVWLQYEDQHIEQQDISHVFRAQYNEYNKLVTKRAQSSIVPNPANPGRIMTNPDVLENTVVRQNSRSAGLNQRRDQR